MNFSSGTFAVSWPLHRFLIATTLPTPVAMINVALTNFPVNLCKYPVHICTCGMLTIRPTIHTHNEGTIINVPVHVATWSVFTACCNVSAQS